MAPAPRVNGLLACLRRCVSKLRMVRETRGRATIGPQVPSDNRMPIRALFLLI